MNIALKWKRQPYKGLIIYFTALIVSSFWLSAVSVISSDYYETGINWGFSWFFFGFAILGFWELWPFTKFRQPLKGIVLSVSALVFGFSVYTIIGAIDQMYIFNLPQWFFSFMLLYISGN